MKALRHSLILTVITLVFWSCGTSRSYLYSQGYDEYYDNGYQGGGISFNVFYNELTPHGRWINDRSYGRIWIPNVGRDFHPYATNGYWTFVPSGYMYNRSMHRYYNRYSPTIYNRTTIINNTYIYNNKRYYSGPSARDY